MKKLFKSSNDIVLEIHNEFDTAQDRLLMEAKSIIANADQELASKANRLEKIGFVNSETVIKVKKLNLVNSLEEARVIEYYKQNYPFQKFLTEMELERICSKYKLIFAPVANYIKDVPAKNLEEIENVKDLKNNDFAEDIKYSIWKFDNSFWFCAGPHWAGLFSKWRKILPRKLDMHFSSEFGVNDHLNNVYNTDITYLCASVLNYTTSKQGLFIAAPKSHFDLKGLNQSGAFGFMNVSILPEPKDPIVFRYCKGGVQVLSKWGLEGEDESFLNEKMN